MTGFIKSQASKIISLDSWPRYFPPSQEMVSDSWGSSSDPDPAGDMKYEMFCADRIEKSWSGIGLRPGPGPTHEPGLTTTIRYCSCRALSSDSRTWTLYLGPEMLFIETSGTTGHVRLNVSDWDNCCPGPRWVIMCCIKYNSYNHNIRPFLRAFSKLSSNNVFIQAPGTVSLTSNLKNIYFY